MKRVTITTLLAAQLLGAAQPVLAADFASGQEIRGGAFGGLTLRVPLGGDRRENRLRAGLALAPTLSSRSNEGAVRTRIGEGLEFGYRSGRPLAFSIAGRDLQPRGRSDGGDRRNALSTGEILLIAGGVIVVTVGVVAVVFIDAINDNSE